MYENVNKNGYREFDHSGILISKLTFTFGLYLLVTMASSKRAFV